MTTKCIRFFQHDAAAPAPEPPRLAICADCLEEANPCWGDGKLTYCAACVPDALRRPQTSAES